MKFSVIVPVYKVERYLPSCVDSILAQTYPDFELILVDDGSPDRCPAICDEYAARDARVRVIHKPNGGSTSARKAGAAMARGEYILSVDGDDLVKEMLLRTVADILADGDCDVVCFEYERFCGEKTEKLPLKYRTGRYDRSRIKQEIFPSLVTAADGTRFSPSVVNKAFRRELFLPIQEAIPDEIRMGEDSCLAYTAIVLAQSLYLTDEILYRYRITEDSMTQQRKKALSWDEPYLRAKFYERVMQGDIFVPQIARITAHSLFNVATSVFYVKKYGEAKREIRRELEAERYLPYLAAARFRGSRKERLALFCVKHRWVFPIWMYQRLRK